MTFEEWWAANWIRMTGQPEIMNLAFKEIAQKAWNASMEQVVVVADLREWNSIVEQEARKIQNESR